MKIKHYLYNTFVIESGDKKIDINNTLIFDLLNGYLIFPSTTPFDTTTGSLFNIDPELRVDIYKSNDRSPE